MKCTFIGRVAGLVEYDDGRIELRIEDTDKSEFVMMYAANLKAAFNPAAAIHGYGAREVPCDVKPGLTDFRFVLDASAVKGIEHGSTVSVELAVFCVRKVVFIRRKGAWAGVPEIRVELVKVQLAEHGKAEVKAK